MVNLQDGGWVELPRMISISKTPTTGDCSVSLALSLRSFSLHSECREDVPGDFEVSHDMGHTTKGSSNFMLLKGPPRETVLRLRCGGNSTLEDLAEPNILLAPRLVALPYTWRTFLSQHARVCPAAHDQRPHLNETGSGLSPFLGKTCTCRAHSVPRSILLMAVLCEPYYFRRLRKRAANATAAKHLFSPKRTRRPVSCGMGLNVTRHPERAR